MSVHSFRAQQKAIKSGEAFLDKAKSVAEADADATLRLLASELGRLRRGVQDGEPVDMDDPLQMLAYRLFDSQTVSAKKMGSFQEVERFEVESEGRHGSLQN
jgi:hypothetical protein